MTANLEERPLDLIFEQLNPRGCKTYLLASSRTGEAWLVDPVLDYIDEYMVTLKKRKLTLSFTIDTHTHADHISGSPKLKDLTNCAYLMHSLARPTEVTDKVADGTQLYLDGELISVLHTPGHTRDSLCLVMPDKIITGDTLFLDEGGAGRDDLPGGDPAMHWESLQRLSELHDGVIVHPGHDYRNRVPSTILEQKERNPFFRPRSQSEYVRFVEELRLGPADWMKEVVKANLTGAREQGRLYIPKDISACEAQGTMSPCANQMEPQAITARELKQLLDEKTNLLLLDVRETAELTGELGHLPGIVHIPVGSISSRFLELKPYAQTEIISICKMGGRASTAAKILLGEGFPKVRVLTGGMTAWAQNNLPVETTFVAAPAPTNFVSQ